MNYKFKLLALTLSIVSPFAFADDIEKITVHGVRYHEDGTYTNVYLGNDVTIISNEMIHAAGGVDINKILSQFVPGLFANGRAGRHTDTDYSLQGSRPQDILWLLDGNRLNNRLYGSTYTDSINPMLIERIEVIKGAQSVLFGSEAIAGVINIITKSYQGSDSAELSLAADTLPSYDLSGFVSSEIESLQLSLAASSSQSEGYALWPDEEYSPTAALDKERGYQMNNLNAKLRWALSDNHQLTVFAQYSDGLLERPLAYDAILSENQRKQTIAYVDWQLQASDQLLLQAKVNYQHWDSRYSEITQDENGNAAVTYWQQYWGFKELGAQVSANYQTQAGSQWILGGQYEEYEGADEVMLFTADKDHTYSLFSQYQPHIGALPDTQLSIGARVNRLANDETIWVGNFALTHDIAQDLQLKGSLGNAYRQPTASELHAKVGTLGNPELMAETSQSINLGLQYQGDISITLDGYWRSIDNLIEPRVISDVEFIYDNLDARVESYGIDLHLVSELSAQLLMELSGSYASAERQDTGEQIERIPEYTGFAKLSYDLNDDISIWASGQYVGEFVDYGLIAGDYMLANVGIQAWITPMQEQQVSLTIDNLFDSEVTQSIFKHGHKAEYPIASLGAPRTLQLQYRYLF
ncbi:MULTISPECIES: TonB-dependent siderophore receptor [unclassified Shewanella]|uniref:TonB-dependent receptor plug domain-containing protein n=1 Tax=unclassified Shewanella TaxID=196818 RepID=UPI001BBCE915|nr:MULTISPECIES: TonB-dependent receptor [unclassified Shewanella]GIU09156.1 outer membrane protein [Shewanella sp. MBTL60-112-B1]GIU29019.1 outer membrane protein [Shewanella sp. MBTL60-112-B2]